MRRRLFVILTFLIAIIIVAPVYSQTTVAYWEFDEGTGSTSWQMPVGTQMDTKGNLQFGKAESKANHYFDDSIDEVKLTAAALDPSDFTHSLNWSTASSMNNARYGFPACVSNGKIYVFGGAVGASSYISSVEEYDPISDTWTSKTSMTNSIYGPGAANINGNIFLIGGTHSSSPLSTTNLYDPSNETWITKGSMNYARYLLGVVAIDDDLYAIGGYSPSQRFSNVEKYNSSSNSWTTKSSISEKKHAFGKGVINGRIYIAGGHNGSGPVSSVEEYDPATDSWTTKTSMPTARYGVSSVVVNNKLYVIGGHTGSQPLSTVEIYDPNTDSWTTSTSLPIARYQAAAVTINNKIYVMGGFNSSSSKLKSVDVLQIEIETLSFTVDAKQNCLDLSDVSSGGAPAVSAAIAAGTFSISVSGSPNWYPGGPSYGEVCLLMTNVSKISNVSVGNADMQQYVLKVGDTLSVTFLNNAKVYGWLTDTGNNDNSGQFTVKIQ